MKAILTLMKEAKREVFTNPENPAERVEEMTARKMLRGVLNFEGKVDGWNVKVTTDIKVGGHCATILHGWRAA